MKNFELIREMGEESGREEAQCDWPYQDDEADYRTLYHNGRGRAQGLYMLRGKAARYFARSWAMGYQADCNLLRLENGPVDERLASERS